MRGDAKDGPHAHGRSPGLERATTRGESDVAAGSDDRAVTEDRLSSERALSDREPAGRASAERTTKIAASRQSGGGPARRTARTRPARDDGPAPMVLVRLLVVLGLAAIVVALLLYLFTRDRRYLRFIVQVVKLLVAALAGVLIFFAVERALVML